MSHRNWSTAFRSDKNPLPWQVDEKPWPDRRSPYNSRMTVKEILAKLESLGDDARRRHNAKAGAPENQFGVKHGDIRTLAKKVKTDHALALELWETGNVEAQLLAALII